MKKLFLFLFSIIFSSTPGFSQGAWQTSTAISTVSSYRGATAIHYDGDQQNMYVFGGWSTSSGNFNETSIYNYLADSWSAGPMIPEDAKGGSAVCIDDDIYLLIGNDGVDGNINSKIFLRYNVPADEWEYLAEYPVAARYVSMVYNPVNALIYCAGGSGDSYAAIDQVNAYDKETDTWISCTPLPYISSGGSALVHQGNHLYLIGGLINQPYDKLFKGLIDVDDPSIISWLPAMSLPVEMVKVSAGYIGNGQILATELTGSHIYDISTDQWTSAEDKPNPVKGGNFVSFEAGGSFILAVAGGKGEDDLIVDHVEYFEGDENVKYPATFVVNFFSGGETVNAQIEVAENVGYTDENGCLVQYLGDGSYDYIATFEGLVSSGSFSIDGDGVFVEVLLPVGVNEIPLNFAMYPNPSHGLLHIEMENFGLEIEKLEISVMDAAGRSVYNSRAKSSGSFNLDLSALNKGIYYILLSGAGATITARKFIIY